MTTVSGRTSFVTTTPAPTTAPQPTLTPGDMVQPAVQMLAELLRGARHHFPRRGWRLGDMDAARLLCGLASADKIVGWQINRGADKAADYVNAAARIHRAVRRESV